jgi:ribosomal protein L20A (L18A)
MTLKMNNLKEICVVHKALFLFASSERIRRLHIEISGADLKVYAL